MRYRFIKAEKVNYPLGVLCRVMDVSPSAYHAYVRGSSHTREREEGRDRRTNQGCVLSSSATVRKPADRG